MAVEGEVVGGRIEQQWAAKVTKELRKKAGRSSEDSRERPRVKTRAAGAAVLVNDGGGWEYEQKSCGRSGLELDERQAPGFLRGCSRALPW